MDAISQQLLGQGVLGVVCVLLLVALRMVFKLYVDSQEKRISETSENRTAIERNTSAFAALTEIIKATTKG